MIIITYCFFNMWSQFRFVPSQRFTIGAETPGSSSRSCCWHLKVSVIKGSQILVWDLDTSSKITQKNIFFHPLAARSQWNMEILWRFPIYCSHLFTMVSTGIESRITEPWWTSTSTLKRCSIPGNRRLDRWAWPMRDQSVEPWHDTMGLPSGSVYSSLLLKMAHLWWIVRFYTCWCSNAFF